MWRHDRQRRRLGVNMGLSVCAETGARRVAKKNARQACKRRSRRRSNVTESQAPPGGDETDAEDARRSILKDKQWLCYYEFETEKLEESRPTLVGWLVGCFQLDVSDSRVHSKSCFKESET